MIDLIIPTLTVLTMRYPYTINEEGTRNISTGMGKPEIFNFKFDYNALEKIICRDGPQNINIDNEKNMFFHFDRNYTLSGIILEDDHYVWILKDIGKFLNDCKESYIKQKVIEKFALMMNSVTVPKTDETVYDEFDEEE